MEDLNVIISSNLKKIRRDRKLSLDKVSEMTGVSKSMLGQIERGESNPTITTVWKIANGLKISFTTLLNKGQADAIIITNNDIEPMVEDDGKYKLYPFFPFEDGRKFEVYKVDIEKGGYLSAEAHGQGTYELITVFSGEITIQVDDQEYSIKKGEAIKFMSDKPHKYFNNGNVLTSISMVIYYP